MEIGDRVRILRDEYPELVGLVGTVENISDDGTCVWVVKHPPAGVWCAISHLERLDTTA